ncbi:class I SAM-dependent methyltransferase, partial [Thermococcus sp.]|uniref:class I SAM-dependent methyltransferase n=1 Tax=Thermococcus sp. TaxID=35749 RepID=UPI0025D508DA
FVGARLAWFGIYREEVRLRLKLAREVAGRTSGRVLDVGSGSGYPALLMALSGNAGEVVGIELDRHIFEFSKRLEKLAKNLRFINGDFFDRGLELGGFDTVAFSYILHDFAPRPFLERALEVLKPGGRIIVGDFDINGLRETLKRFAREKRVKLLENLTLGEAHTHRQRAEAFIFVMEVPK